MNESKGGTAKTASRKILVVDDERSAREGLAELLASWGNVTESAADGNEGLAKVGTFQPHVMITDLTMPNMDGLALLKAVKSGPFKDTAVVVLTAHGTIDGAVEAIREGAYDFLTKPLEDFVRLRLLIEKLAERQGLETEVRDLRSELERIRSFENLVGSTPVMKEVYRQIEVVAPSTASVLIHGASGTGKELVAKGIHNRSRRANGPFVAINCSAIPATLLESEIFGHERGAFTGAIARKEGCFEIAHGGTLFLDEIAEMPFELQSKFLRVLEDGKFRRLGGKDEIEVDVRVIAASNKDFRKAIAEKQFREDLYYRLNVFGLSLPSLSERAEDIPILAEHFVREFSARNRKGLKGISPEAMRILTGYAWPGNVRELKNVIERSVIMSTKSELTAVDLPESLTTSPDRAPQITLRVGCTMEEAEKEIIRRTLESTGGNKTRAAKILDISLKTLHNKLNEYGLRNNPPRPASAG